MVTHFILKITPVVSNIIHALTDRETEAWEDELIFPDADPCGVQGMRQERMGTRREKQWGDEAGEAGWGSTVHLGGRGCQIAHTSSPEILTQKGEPMWPQHL